MAGEGDPALNEFGTPNTGDAAPPPIADTGPQGASDLEAVYDMPLQVSAVLCRATMQANQFLKLACGAAVELDRKVGGTIDRYDCRPTISTSMPRTRPMRPWTRVGRIPSRSSSRPCSSRSPQ